jgi:hypothetical protein
LANKEQDNSGMKVAEKKFLRKAAKYTLFDQKNQDILKELKTQTVLVQITGYNTKLLVEWTD